MDSRLSRIRRWVPCACYIISIIYNSVLSGWTPTFSYQRIFVVGPTCRLMYCTTTYCHLSEVRKYFRTKIDTFVLSKLLYVYLRICFRKYLRTIVHVVPHCTRTCTAVHTHRSTGSTHFKVYLRGGSCMKAVQCTAVHVGLRVRVQVQLLYAYV